MSEPLTNEQQVELLKKLWKEYGVALTAGALIAIAITVGWRFYQKYTIQKAQQASIIYERLLVDMNDQKLSQAEKQSDVLIHQFAHTPYATLAKFMLAKIAVEQNHLDTSAYHLNWVIQHSHNRNFRQIARIRLARIYLEQDKFQAAIKTLEKIDNPSFQGLILETRGDIYAKQGQIDQAKLAYQAALNKTSDQISTYPLIQMKLGDLPK